MTLQILARHAGYIIAQDLNGNITLCAKGLCQVVDSARDAILLINDPNIRKTLFSQILGGLLI